MRVQLTQPLGKPHPRSPQGVLQRLAQRRIPPGAGHQLHDQPQHPVIAGSGRQQAAQRFQSVCRAGGSDQYVDDRGEHLARGPVGNGRVQTGQPAEVVVDQRHIGTRAPGDRPGCHRGPAAFREQGDACFHKLLPAPLPAG